MTTMSTYDLEIYVEVVKRGSFTKAAEALGSEKAYLSRVVSKLEAHLNTKLLQRSTRALSMTEAGRELFERARAILAALEETELRLQSKQSEPQGVLKLTSGVEFGLLVVNKWVNKFLHQHPLARVDFEQTNRVVDLVHDGFDLAIRVGELKDSSLSARRIGELRYGLFASPGYLKLVSTPKKVEDLERMDVIAFSVFSAQGLRVQRGNQTFETKRPPRLIANGSMSARDAAMADLGVAMLPLIYAAEFEAKNKLVRILPEWTRPSAPVHAVFPSNKYLTPKVRSFVDLAVSEFAQIKQ